MILVTNNSAMDALKLALLQVAVHMSGQRELSYGVKSNVLSDYKPAVVLE